MNINKSKQRTAYQLAFCAALEAETAGTNLKLALREGEQGIPAIQRSLRDLLRAARVLEAVCGELPDSYWREV